MLKEFMSVVLALGLVLGGGTTAKNEEKDLTDKVEKQEITAVDFTSSEYAKISPKEELTQFSIELLQENFKDKNILISPLSIISALGMTANGADGQTKTQMEQVFGTDVDTLNDYLYAYITGLPNTKDNQINLANSIWIRDNNGLKVKSDFLKTTKTYYDSQVYQAPFDNKTKNQINEWVKKETDGMIPKILEKAPSKEAVMYLVNALSFDGKWEEPYRDFQLEDGIFTTQSGEKQDISFMNDTLWGYIRLENAGGFSKSYRGGQYEFVALLPDKDITMEEFLKTLDGEKLMQSLKNRQPKSVQTKLPKFSTEYSSKLNDSLKALGMGDAFSPEKADFSKMASSKQGNIYINDVIHKTKIEVNEKGTKAAAVTMVEMNQEAAMEEEEPEKIYLDRPFFYMIVDTEQNFPVFMGSLMEVNSESVE